MRRRLILGLTGLGVMGLAFRYWPEDGLTNPCPQDPLPQPLLEHDLVQSAWDGIDPALVWDVHCHLIGSGDSGSGMWVNPDMESLAHPIQWLQRAFYLNASCIPAGGHSALNYIEQLHSLLNQLPTGLKILLLAFDWFHDETGNRVEQTSAFYTPGSWAARIAESHPDRFEWIASIHPYRADSVAALREAVKHGARAVKWLPPAQGMDPASPACDAFYEAAADLDIPLLVHAGAELAVHGGNTEDFGNPLRLRRPLEHGVRVVVAHCASLGSAPDLDIGPAGPQRPCFELFARMMDEPRHEGLLYGEISGITQINRFGNALARVLERGEWHHRLLNGSDYPLPGILPLFSLKELERAEFIRHNEARVLSEIRSYNALLFDFVLKRTIRKSGASLGRETFHTRKFFRSGS